MSISQTFLETWGAARKCASRGRNKNGGLSPAARGCSVKMTRSISVVIALVGAFRLDADIVGLVLAQLGQLGADLGEMQPRHLLVQRLRQHIDLLFVFAVLVVGPELDLRQRLVGEGS